MTSDFILNAATQPELHNWIAKLIQALSSNVGNVGLSIVVFTIILKLILSPLDIWQKIAQHKQSKGMKRIQPQLTKLQEQFKSRPDIFRQEQRKLFKQEKISMFGSILPMLITMIVFFVVFAGFNEWVRYQNETILYNLYQQYLENSSLNLAEAYETQIQNFKFLWIKNVFMPDSWASVVADYKTYAGQGLGAINASVAGINIPDFYNTLIGPAMQAHKKKAAFDMANWNGYLILPILSVALSLVSAKLLKPPTPPTTAVDEQQKKAQNMSMKMMTYMMPIMIGVLSIFYSSAFSIYLFVSNLVSTLFALIFTIIFKQIDKKKGEN